MKRSLQHIARAVAFTVLVAHAHSTELLSFQAGDAGWNLGTLAVGNLDGDAALEIVVPYRDSTGAWFLDAFKADGTRLAGFPYAGNAEINTSPTLYDLDNDGRDEIIFTCGNRVIAMRGNGTVIWSTRVSSSNYVPNAGYMSTRNGFYLSNGGGFRPHLPATAVFSSQVSSPIVADIAGNGKKLVVTAWKIDPDSTSSFQDYNPVVNDIWGSGEWGTMGETWSGGVVFFNAMTGARNYVYHFHQLVESGLALGHADAGAALETYVLNDSDSVVCFDKTRPPGFLGSGNLIGQFGKNQRLMSGAYEQGVDIYTVDLDNDGRDEVLVPTTQLNPPWQPNETILDSDGTILWRKWKQPVSFPLQQWQNSACMIPVNPDHDNHIDVLSFTHSYEIAFRYWNGVELVDRPGWPKDFYPYLPTPPVMGDVDGDGQEEIVIGTYDPANPGSDGALQIFSLDGVLKFSVPVPGGLKHIPAIANVYGNGLDVVYRSLNGRVYIQNFGSTNSGPVSWATHRGNMHRDGNLGVSLFPPGTPSIISKDSGYGSASFSWASAKTNPPQCWWIYRAEQPSGPFLHIATLSPEATTFTDAGLKSGCQYIYEVAAIYGTNIVRSPPFPMLSQMNSNLVANSGFEENDNSHWDKWFTGDIDWSNMVASTDVAYEGNQSMKITLNNSGNNGSISQYSQYGIPRAYLPVTKGRLYSFGAFFKSDGISKPSEHWIEWSSTKTAQNHANRPARPYPLYFTPHFTPGTGPTDWVYANRTFVLPTGFPNVELTHWFTIDAPGSGSLYIDNVFFRALPSPSSTNWNQLLPFGASWRYFTNTPPANWSDPDFDDTSWRLGFAKFGAGSGPKNIATTLPQRQPAYYFRRTFVAPNAPLGELLLSATCTDQDKPMDIYLNGVRLVTTGIEAVSAQGNDVLYYDLTPFSKLVQPGTNTIAIAIGNVFQPSWDDVAFDVNLKAITSSSEPPRLSVIPPTNDSSEKAPATAAAAAATGLELTVTAPTNTIWRVESADSLDAPWQLVEVVTNNTGTIQLFDTGQNNRMPPAAAPERTYRFIPE